MCDLVCVGGSRRWRVWAERGVGSGIQRGSDEMSVPSRELSPFAALACVAVCGLGGAWYYNSLYGKRSGGGDEGGRVAGALSAEDLLLGVELGGTTCVAAVARVATPTEVIGRIEVPTTSPDETLGAIKTWAHAQEGHIGAIGVASFGPIQLDYAAPNYGEILRSTPKIPFRGSNLVARFKDFGVPIHLDTDVNAPALAELKYGGHSNATSCVYITVGTGVGVGAVVNDRPVHGLMHMEGGHYRPRRLVGDEYQGWCATHGDCLEGLVSSRALADRSGVEIAHLAELPDDDPVWRTAAYYLAELCATVTFLLSPHVIVLGGGIMKRRPLLGLIHQFFLEIMNGYVDLPEVTQDVDKYIVRSVHESESGIIGAIALAAL